MHTVKCRPPRERAARALCDFYSLDPDQIERDLPRWERHLPEVDTVLMAALTLEDWLRIQRQG